MSDSVSYREKIENGEEAVERAIRTLRVFEERLFEHKQESTDPIDHQAYEYLSDAVNQAYQRLYEYSESLTAEKWAFDMGVEETKRG